MNFDDIITSSNKQEQSNMPFNKDEWAKKKTSRKTRVI